MHPFRRERVLRQLSQHACAKVARMSQSKLSLIECGYSLPSAEEARRLAAIVECDANLVFPDIRQDNALNSACVEVN